MHSNWGSGADRVSSGDCREGMVATVMWYSVVIFTAMGLPMVQIDDQRGPYPHLPQCYQRGSVMINDVITSGKFPPVIHAQALCIDSEKKEVPGKDA